MPISGSGRASRRRCTGRNVQQGCGDFARDGAVQDAEDRQSVSPRSITIAAPLRPGGSIRSGNQGVDDGSLTSGLVPERPPPVVGKSAKSSLDRGRQLPQGSFGVVQCHRSGRYHRRRNGRDGVGRERVGYLGPGEPPERP